MMTYLKKIAFFTAVTVLSAFFAALFVGMIVISQSRISERAQEQYYKQQEQQYVKELRACLAEQGYENSGITLTSVTYADGSLTYTATIHHARIDRLDQAAREELSSRLAQFPTPHDNAPVSHEFLILNP